MGTLERLASELADDTMKAMTELDDWQMHQEVARVISASSQSLEEAYLTEMRVRMTERTARAYLEKLVAERRASAG